MQATSFKLPRAGGKRGEQTVAHRGAKRADVAGEWKMRAYKLQVTSHKLKVTSYNLQVINYITGEWKMRAGARLRSQRPVDVRTQGGSLTTVTRYKVQGTRYKVQGTRHKVQGTRYKVQGTR